MKKGNVRYLTHKDLEGSEHKSSSMSEFDKLAEVCRVACELYDQHKQNNLSIFDTHCAADKSLGKRLVGEYQETNKEKEPVFSCSRACRISGEELFKGARKKCRGGTSSSSRYYEYAYVRRSWGDHGDQVVTEKVLGRKRRCYDLKDGAFEYYDQVVTERVLGKKRNCYDLKDENFEYCDQMGKERVLGMERDCYDKSLEKRPVTTHHQESNKQPFSSSRTCRISEEELFKGGCKKSRGETSSFSRYYEYANVRRSWGDHDDQVVTEKVLRRKRKCYDSKDEDFEYYDQVMKERVLGNKRNWYDFKDEDSEGSEKNEKKPRSNNYKARNRIVETAPLPVRFADEIQRLGGNDVRLLIQKNLSATDLNPKENRLNIPTNQTREEAKDFLTEAENLSLDKRDAKGKIVPMQVPVLEPNLKRSHIDFKKWVVNKSPWYVLCGSWTAMQTSNHLEVGSDLQVWSFRVNEELNLALVEVPLPDPEMQQ
ncbi:uncharacterized protein LOC141710574 [Apium graveolens]|uniref:uncharacterized protein LOC141710574 n=1 Tax=Apium graveolens TaxID=4045 RepID=UPI003D7B86E9